MPRLITTPTTIKAVGNKPKQIQEFVGRANTNDSRMSVARMISPGGWKEPGQRPEFQEITLVLRGTLYAQHEGGCISVHSGQAIVVEPEEWIRYSTPEEEGAEYIAICLPAFSQDSVHRDAPCSDNFILR